MHVGDTRGLGGGRQVAHALGHRSAHPVLPRYRRLKLKESVT